MWLNNGDFTFLTQINLKLTVIQGLLLSENMVC